MKTVSQINTVLSGYLPPAAGQSPATTMILMMNQVQPKLYAEGNWPSLTTEYIVDVSAGYFCLPNDYECVLSASLDEYPVQIRSLDYETRRLGTGTLGRSVSIIYGFVDKGYVALMSDIASVGCDELIFTCPSASFASGDTATITYTDSEDGYAQVVLPLQTITVDTSIASGDAVTAGSGTQTKLTVTSTTGLVAGLGLKLTQVTGTDATYVGTFRIAVVDDATHVTIEKDFVALTGTVSAASTPRLMPANSITSVESLEYASLPGKTMVKDADGIIYAILSAGDGCSKYRRYECPQIPSDTTEEWTARCVVKRKFMPLTANSEFVLIDNINALKHGMLAVIAEDNADLDRADKHWANAIKILNEELYDCRGGVEEMPLIEPWGPGVRGIMSLYG